MDLAGRAVAAAAAANGAAGRSDDQSSLPQSRGVIFFSVAYLAACSTAILRVNARSPAMKEVTCLKLWPSHCWNLTIPEPSWSEQLVLIGGKRPGAPSSLIR